jgi:hypothetical protein
LLGAYALIGALYAAKLTASDRICARLAAPVSLPKSDTHLAHEGVVYLRAWYLSTGWLCPSRVYTRRDTVHYSGDCGDPLAVVGHHQGDQRTGANLTAADLTEALWPANEGVPDGWQRDVNSGPLEARRR